MVNAAADEQNPLSAEVFAHRPDRQTRYERAHQH